MLKKCLPLLLLCTAPVFAKPVLTVYTYDSFAADWGPGPVVKKAFEADCNCELKLVYLLMQWLILEKTSLSKWKCS